MPDKKQILVVDDEQMCRDLIIEILKPYDYEINIAQNGEEALEYFNRSHCDLLITDVRMPKISGIELLKKIWTFHSHDKSDIYYR